MTIHAWEPTSAEDNETLGKFLSSASFWNVDYIYPSAWVEHGPFAFWLVEAMAPTLIVELGTHGGFSFLAFCQAMQRLGLDGRCFAVDTWKGDAHSGLYGEEIFARLQQYNDQHYATFSRLVRSTFDEAVPHFSEGSIDLLHLDGRHFYEDVRHDFEGWLPKLSDRAVVLFHDTNVRERGFGVFRLWDELRQRYPHFEFFHGHGLGVLGVGNRIPARVQALFDAADNTEAVGLVRRVYARLGQGVGSEMMAGARVSERDHIQRELKAQLTEEHRIQDELRAQLVEERSKLDQVRNELQSLDEERAQLRAEAQRLESKNSELTASLAVLEHRSPFWRETGPLRALGRIAQVLGRR